MSSKETAIDNCVSHKEKCTLIDQKGFIPSRLKGKITTENK